MRVMICVAAMTLLLAMNAAAADKDRITAELKNAAGESIGTAELIQIADIFRPGSNIKYHGGKGLDIKLSLHNLPPGEHGIHIHRDPVCEGPDFKTAGGHINPENKQHGLKNPEGPHAGDLPNITADANGNVKTTITTTHVGMAQLKAGRSLVIHANPDDQMTDPAGNSGARIAFGVIKE